MENWKTQYNESEFLQSEIDFFQNNKEEFCESILWEEDRDPLTITKDEIEDHFYMICIYTKDIQNNFYTI